MFKIHCFICATSLYPEDRQRDQILHEKYFKHYVDVIPTEWVDVTIIQNGCNFPVLGVDIIRHPFAKNLAYNWLVCDFNSREEYWVFVPEDCRINVDGWDAISQHIRSSRECFSLSKDPQVVIGKRGIFGYLSQEILTLCDMNFLGKEIGCIILRDELAKRNFHSISSNWKKINSNPDRWGNELYEEINDPDHPDTNKTLRRPFLRDYGVDGVKREFAPWHLKNPSRENIENGFMDIVSRSLESHLRDADSVKELISRYGPKVTDVQHKKFIERLRDRFMG